MGDEAILALAIDNLEKEIFIKTAALRLLQKKLKATQMLSQDVEPELAERLLKPPTPYSVRLGAG